MIRGNSNNIPEELNKKTFILTKQSIDKKSSKLLDLKDLLKAIECYKKYTKFKTITDRIEKFIKLLLLSKIGVCDLWGGDTIYNKNTKNRNLDDDMKEILNYIMGEKHRPSSIKDIIRDLNNITPSEPSKPGCSTYKNVANELFNMISMPPPPPRNPSSVSMQPVLARPYSQQQPVLARPYSQQQPVVPPVRTYTKDEKAALTGLLLLKANTKKRPDPTLDAANTLAKMPKYKGGKKKIPKIVGLRRNR